MQHQQHPQQTKIIPEASLCDWWSGYTGSPSSLDDIRRERANRREILPLIDIRSDTEYYKRRIEPTLLLKHDFIQSATSLEQLYKNIPTVIHIPFESLLNGQRSCELPPRFIHFAILASSSSFDTTVSKSPQDTIINFFFASQSPTTCQSRQPWKLQYIIWGKNDHDDEEDWLRGQQMGIPIVLGNDFNDKIHNDRSSFLPPPRLWSPDPLIQFHLLPLLQQFIDDYINQKCSVQQQHQSPMCNDDDIQEILDLGCGSGRDICFLATELKFYFFQRLLHIRSFSSLPSNTIPFPFRFIGMDHHKGSSKRCLPLWKQYQVQDITCAVRMDLDKIQDWRANSMVCIYAVRYLNRKILLDLNTTDTSCPLKPGTIFALSHFCKEPHQSWDFEHPKVGG